MEKHLKDKKGHTQTIEKQINNHATVLKVTHPSFRLGLFCTYVTVQTSK